MTRATTKAKAAKAAKDRAEFKRLINELPPTALLLMADYGDRLLAASKLPEAEQPKALADLNAWFAARLEEYRQAVAKGGAP